MSRTGRTLLSVIAVVAVCVGVTEVTAPAEPAPSGVGERVPVTSALSACPYAESEGTAALSSRISAAVPPPVPAAMAARSADEAGEEAPTGAAVVTRLDDATQEIIRIEAPGPMSFAELDELDGGESTFVASASGPTAPGFTVSSTTVLETTERRGLASMTCPEPGTEFWFVGAGVDASRDSALTVVNAESAPAQYDVEIYGPNGLLDLPTMRQRTLAPGAVEGPLPLSVAVENNSADGATSLVAVHVIVRVGRVVAGLSDRVVKDDQAHGLDWLQPVEEPSTTAVIPGIPGKPNGERTLFLFAPGTEGALVNLRLAGPNGLFTPVDIPPEGKQAVELDAVSLGAGQVVALPLGRAAGGEPFSVMIDADRPVIGAVRVGTGAKVPDYGYVAMTPELGGPSVIADVREDKSFKSSILLTAPQAPATIALTALIPGEEPKELQPVRIETGRTAVVSMTDVEVGAAEFALVVTPEPGSGPVYGSRMMTRAAGDNPFFTIEALIPSRTTSLVPEIVGDVSAGLRPADPASSD